MLIMQRTLNAMTPEQLKVFASENPSAERKTVNDEYYYVIQ